MIFFKKKYLVRRFSKPTYVNGYSVIPYTDVEMALDIQTQDYSISIGEDGSTAVQTIKAFCDQQLLIENTETNQKADRVFFNNKWFECKSCRLSNNTFIRHYIATFIECLDGGESD